MNEWTKKDGLSYALCGMAPGYDAVSEAEAKIAATLAAAVPAVLYSCDDVNLRPLGSSRRNYRVPTTHIWTARLHTKYIEARMYVGAALKAELSTLVRCFMEFA